MIDFWSFTYAFGIDWLMWAFGIMVVITAIDYVIPDPIPFVDEAVLTLICIGLLLALAARGTAEFINDIMGVIGHPLVLTFLISMAVLVIGGKIANNQKKKKVKR